jgi:hypothetical protein
MMEWSTAVPPNNTLEGEYGRSPTTYPFLTSIRCYEGDRIPNKTLEGEYGHYSFASTLYQQNSRYIRHYTD